MLYVLSVVTIELSVAARALRVDLPAFFALFRRRPQLLLLIPTAAALAVLSGGGVDALVSLVLLTAPFAALHLGEMMDEGAVTHLRRFAYVMAGLAWVQLVTGSRIVGVLYQSGHTNPLPHSIFATEPSFGFEALFATALLVIALSPGTRNLLPLLLVGVLGVVAGVLTVVQNLLVLAAAAVWARSRFGSSTAAGRALLLAPALIVYLIPNLVIDRARWVLTEFESWRQVSNAVAIGDSGWIALDLHDYRSLVTDRLVERGDEVLATFIQSAFSWFPFVHSVGGRALALGLLLLILRRIPAMGAMTSRERTVVVCSLLLFLYTAPKWQLFSLVTVGAVSGQVRRRLADDVSTGA